MSAMSPTPAGEGKSTTTVGLADSLARAGHRVMIALREPSLGPILGMKGGATGGGYSQVLPMDQINLHFTGDFHAITSANNALMALVDNHIFQGNELNIDPRRMTFKRVLDMNDRSLREVVIGLGGPAQGVPRQDGFDITVASEIMAVFCLATDLADLRERLGRITFGYTYDRLPVTVADLGVQGALTMLLKDAIKPNLVQTIAGTPALVHGGPFANIAHGCNSLIATLTARRLADIVVTEAGFGADLGAEKYMDIKARVADVAPSAVVLVATVRALKMHGGVAAGPARGAQRGGAGRRRGQSPAPHPQRREVRHHTGGRDQQIRHRHPGRAGLAAGLVRGRGRPGRCGRCLGAGRRRRRRGRTGGQGPGCPRRPAQLPAPVCAGAVGGGQDPDHRAGGVRGGRRGLLRPGTETARGNREERLVRHLPVCMAKTQYSFSDDATKLGAPKGFTIHVRDLIPKTGAGFIVALTGAVMTMPGLPKVPAAMRMDVDADGNPVGLF